MDSQRACKQMSSLPKLPFPGHRNITSPFSGERQSPDLVALRSINLERASESEVQQHLTSLITHYPSILEEYVVNNVKSEHISQWLAKRKAREENTSKSKTKFLDDDLEKDTSTEKGKVESKVINKVESGGYLRSLFSLTSMLSKMTNSSGFHLYEIGGFGKTLVMYNPQIPQWDPSLSGQRSFLISKKTTVSGHVAFTKRPVILEDVHLDPRFPKRIGADDSGVNGIGVMCVPVILPNGDLAAVAEFYRSWHDACYTVEDLKTVENIFEWVSLGIHKTAVCSSLRQQTEMNNFLLEVARTYLDDITDIDNIIEHIMRFAKTLVSADRCTLFLYDAQRKELYSDLFDDGVEVDGKAVFEKKKEIRFHVSKGIAGFVASSRTFVNIPDAYADPRFNREVDKVTGCTTKNLLCLPIMSKSEIYGVVQMINKKTGGSFTKLDEDNFIMFSIFCALALRYSRIHAKLENEHNSHLVVLEQFRNSMKTPESESLALAKQIEENSLPNAPVDFDRFQFSVLPYDSELPGFFVRMLKWCEPEYQIPAQQLARFTLAIKRNYRNQPYHNWKHAVTVAHCMYCILKRHEKIFTKLEALALIVACIAHDVDHRAYSNQYIQKIEHPLAALYPTSTMEMHHYAMLLMIIKQEGHRIFSNLSSESRNFVLDLMKDAIIATDLALFFNNQKVLNDLVADGEFDINKHNHRRSLIGIMMTSCDLSSTTKKWEPAKETVYDLYREFWAEGDLRKKYGFSFVPMMDRDLVDDVPEGQVGFYSNVSIRCYETLVQVLPECEPLLTNSNENLELWRKEAENIKEKKRQEEELERLQSGAEDGKKLGVMLRGGMWVIEQSRLEEEKANKEG